MRIIYIFSIAISLSSLLTSCGNSADCAIESMVGVWNVTDIYLYSSTADRHETVLSGIFRFESNGNALYSFARNNTIITDSSTWMLTEGEENCGFTNCKIFFLNVGDEEFEVEFGDQTSDAHCGATTIQLLQSGSHLSPYTDMTISLSKS